MIDSAKSDVVTSASADDVKRLKLRVASERHSVWSEAARQQGLSLHDFAERALNEAAIQALQTRARAA